MAIASGAWAQGRSAATISSSGRSKSAAPDDADLGVPSLVFLYPLYPLYPLCPPYPLDSLDSLAYSTYLLKDFFLKWRPGRRPLANERRLGCIAIQHFLCKLRASQSP